MRCVHWRRSLGVLILNCQNKLTLPKSFADCLGKVFVHNGKLVLLKPQVGENFQRILIFIRSFSLLFGQTALKRANRHLRVKPPNNHSQRKKRTGVDSVWSSKWRSYQGYDRIKYRLYLTGLDRLGNIHHNLANLGRANGDSQKQQRHPDYRVDIGSNFVCSNTLQDRALIERIW